MLRTKGNASDVWFRVAQQRSLSQGGILDQISSKVVKLGLAPPASAEKHRRTARPLCRHYSYGVADAPVRRGG